MGRANAAARRKQQEEARKRRAAGGGTTRGHGGGQGNRDRKASTTVKPGSNPLSRAKPTKPGQSAYREEQEARRKAGKTYNPNSKGQRKPSVEPGSNPLQRAAKEQERKEKAAAAKAKADRERKARDNKPTKPTKPAATKPSKPTKPTQPANAGAGNGAPRPTPAEKVPVKKPHIKSDRLRDALKSVKKFKPKK